MSEHARPDVMMAVNDSLRKEFSALPLLVKSTPDGDEDRAAIVAAHIELMVRFMAAQHDAEDEVLWPLVAQRDPEHATSVMDLIDGHRQLDDEARSVAALSRTWSKHPTATTRAELHSALISLERTLLLHLGQEDAEGVPAAAELLTTDEFIQYGGRLWSLLPADQRPIVLGLILDDAKPDLGDALRAAPGTGLVDGSAQDAHPAYKAYRDHLIGA